MTQQVPDICQYDGRQYEVIDWDGDAGVIPSNADLGIETRTVDTAICGGRINHFGVWGGELYLFKIDVTLSEKTKNVKPADSRREVLLRYEQLVDFHGNPSELREYRHEYIVFENLKVPFTGVLRLTTNTNLWDRPYFSVEHDIENINLYFENGTLSGAE